VVVEALVLVNSDPDEAIDDRRLAAGGMIRGALA
jgi:hypothetical protein